MQIHIICTKEELKKTDEIQEALSKAMKPLTALGFKGEISIEEAQDAGKRFLSRQEGTMRKQMLKKAKELSVSSRRLDNDNHEQYPIEWLLKERSISGGYTSKLEMITDIILGMNRNHSNYINTSPEDKAKIEKLIQNPEIVESVVISLFQWFGTNVGKSDVGTLLDEIRALKYEKPLNNSTQCKCVSEMHACQTIGSRARPNPDCKICHGTGIVEVV